MSKKILIFGVSGQVGAIMAKKFLDEGCEVHGFKRKSSSHNTERLDSFFNHPNLHLVYGDKTDFSSVLSFIGDVKPDYCYDLAAQSHVRVSFDIPISTAEITGIGVLNALEACRIASPKTRYLHSASSEMFGSSPPPQSENTEFRPQSIYACAKVFGYHSTQLYRKAYNMFTANSICFNMESSSRSPTFVTRKITQSAARIKMGLQDTLWLGNTKSFRSWHHVLDSVDAMQLILEKADEPDDWVVSSDEMHSVQEFVELVFGKLGLEWEKYVKIDPRLFRPAEVDALMGDSTKIKTKLGWNQKISFSDLVDEMISHDLKLAQQEKFILENSV